MRFSFRKIRLDCRRFLLGALSGTILATTALILIAVPVGSSAQGSAAAQGQLCFSKYECGGETMNQDKQYCDSKEGCCIGDRCFVRNDQFCNPSGKASAVQGYCYARTGQMNLSVSIGGSRTVLDLADYLNLLFKYGLAVAGLLAAVMMMIGGFQYLTAGDSERSSKGRERIANAVTGLVVLFGAWLLLNTISPDLVTLRLPKIPVIKQKLFVGCALTELCRPCGQEYGVKLGPAGEMPTYGAVFGNRACSDTYIGDSGDSGVVAVCMGKGCSFDGKSDAAFRCRQSLASAQTGAADQQSAAGTPSAAWSCESCQRTGSPCSQAGKDDGCCGGYCGQLKAEGLIWDSTYSAICTEGNLGDPCSDKNQCRDGYCESNKLYTCSNGSVGSDCVKASDCRTGFCNTYGTNNCSTGQRYQWCENDSECATPLICNEDADYCLDQGYQLVECGGSQPPSWMNAADRVNRAQLGANTDCSIVSLPFCSGTLGSSGYCTDGSDGAPCASNDGCRTHRCVDHVCRQGQEGSICQKDDDCRGIITTMKCIQGIGGNAAEKYCSSGGPGARCQKNEDCVSPLRCEGFKCVPLPQKK